MKADPFNVFIKDQNLKYKFEIQLWDIELNL